MDKDKVLEVSHLSRKYARQLRHALVYGLRDIGRELWPRPSAEARLRQGEFWALDDLSFDLGRGEALAILGRNGAGKSTLLRILYGLIKPDSGEVRLRGRAEALIELGTGFNPLLTGRENIQVGAALHGVRGAESRRLFDEVVAFSELEEHIDAPIQSYSSGMKARLGYSLAAHLKPDLLLIDEILAVGDAAFQRKCLTHIQSYLAAGGSLIFVSHNIHQVQAICGRGILLDHGRLVFAGSAVETVSRMFDLDDGPDLREATGDAPVGPVRIASVGVETIPAGRLNSGDRARLTLSWSAEEQVEVTWGFSIWTRDRLVCIASAFDTAPRILAAGAGTLICDIGRLPLVAGHYIVQALIADAHTHTPLATFGHERSGLPLDIGARPDLLMNAQRQENHLVTLDVEWR